VILSAAVCGLLTSHLNIVHGVTCEHSRTLVFLTCVLKQDIHNICILFLQRAATVDDAVNCGDSTVSSISTANLTSECKRKDWLRCVSNSKARSYVPVYWGGEIRSLQTDIMYGVNTERVR
jgi:hypothetical protein